MIETRDSILMDSVSEIVAVPSMELKSVESSMIVEPRVRTIVNEQWLSVGFVLLLMLMLYIIGHNWKRYVFALRNLKSGKNRSISYEDAETSIVSTIVLWVIGLLSVTLFLILAALSMPQTLEVLTTPSTLMLMLGLLIGFVVLKYLGFKIVAYTFALQKDVQVYMESYFTIAATMSLLLIPISFGMIYSPPYLGQVVEYIGYIVTFTAFVLVCIKCVQIFFSGYTSIFYIFLYLCALEILPVAVLLKVMF